MSLLICTTDMKSLKLESRKIHTFFQRKINIQFKSLTLSKMQPFLTNLVAWLVEIIATCGFLALHTYFWVQYTTCLCFHRVKNISSFCWTIFPRMSPKAWFLLRFWSQDSSIPHQPVWTHFSRQVPQNISLFTLEQWWILQQYLYSF